MRTDYSQVFQNTTAVEKYDGVQYAADSHSTAVNQRQRRYLHKLVRRTFGEQRPIQHDFACGTGRAVGALQGVVYDAHGYDVSAQMLDRALSHGYRAHWHQIPASGPLPTPELTDGPSIVTIFRLLLNVPDDVRERAIAFAAQALQGDKDGILVVQNHGSRRSLRHLRARKHANNPWYSELSDERVYEIFRQYGFRLVERRGFAMFPRGWYTPKTTRPLIRKLDDVLCRMRILDRYAVDVLYVARHDAAA